MKKIIFLLVCLTTIQISSYAGNDRSIRTDQLPEKAKLFIQEHFKGIDVSYAKMETELFSKSYEVIFVNGAKAEFNKNGEWKEVEHKYEAIPESIIPKKILNYVNTKHTGKKIVEINKDSKDYEIKLSNGIEIEFDLNCNFKKYD